MLQNGHKVGISDLVPSHKSDDTLSIVFEDFLRGGPLISKVPPNVLFLLRAGRPYQVREKAWLVMYYSVLLDTDTVTSASSHAEGLLQHNLQQALSDLGVLLEPSEDNIRASLLAMRQASEFIGPSQSYMLATNACRMLQALGVRQSRLDEQTRERRQVLFWHLNLLDKGLAIIFGRTPTFHRTMVRDIGLPSLEQIQPSRTHSTSSGARGFFGAHYMYHKILLSHLMDDIWDCLHGDSKSNKDRCELANDDLHSWYDRARSVSCCFRE